MAAKFQQAPFGLNPVLKTALPPQGMRPLPRFKGHNSIARKTSFEKHSVGRCGMA
jgi:hypothetical protein